MEFLKEDARSGELVPVLLGFSRKTRRAARRFYRDYGVLSHVFCHKIPLFFRFSFFFKFHKVRATRDETLMMQALLDFAWQLARADVLLYLVPCAEPYTSFVKAHKADLERVYLLSDPNDLQKLWFGKDEEAAK